MLGREERREMSPQKRDESGLQGWLRTFGLSLASSPASTSLGAGASTGGDGAVAGGGGDFYGMLAGALQQAVSMGGSTTGAAKDRSEDLAYPGNLVPPDMSSPEDRMGYVMAQRERLRVLLRAFDREAYNISSEEGQKGKAHRRVSERAETMRSRGSEVDFEKVSWEESPEDVPLPKSPGEKGGGSWMGWIWGSSEKDKGKME